MEVKIVSKYPQLRFVIPGCVTSELTVQDATLPGGIGQVDLDYNAVGPASKLRFTAPGDTAGAWSSDLDSGDPAGVVLTSGNGRNFIVLDVTSLALAAVHVDTSYAIQVKGVGSVLWQDLGSATVKESVEKAVRAQAEFFGANFDGCDLSGADLKGGRFRWASFRGVNLLGTKFDGADCTSADFSGANAAGATWAGTTTTGATLTGSDELAEVVGGLTVGSRAVSSSGAVADTDSTLLVTTGSGAAVVLTLPTAVGRTGKRFRFLKMDAGTTAGQIASTGGQTFSGAASPLLLSTRYHGWDVESDGANWQTAYLTIVLPLAASEKAAASGVASLNGSSLVVQDPANATATPAASKIPIADGSGKLPAGWGGSASGLATLNASSQVVENGTYAAGDASDWATSAPTDVKTALDRIASALKDHLAAAIP